MKGIAHLAQKIAETYYETVPKEQRKGKVQINVSTSFFVPKPFTPFQWAPMFREEDFIEKAKIVKNEIRSQLNQRSIRYTMSRCQSISRSGTPLEHVRHSR